MQIINAKWDELISGYRTCEIVFEKSDTIGTYLEAEFEKKFDFSVVKIPIGNLGLVHKLEDIGYRYLENQLVLSFNTDQLEYINPKWNRLFSGFSFKRLTCIEEISSVITQVNNKMFESDRYSQDPFWTEDLSSKRYSNWIRQLFESPDVRFYSMIRNGEEVGFFSIKYENEKTNSCPIAGIYNRFKYSGFIFVLVWDILVITRDRGADKFFTSISSNNKNLLSSFSKLFNFKVLDTFIVLRKATGHK